MFRTMSSSTAPASSIPRASKSFAAVVLDPCGNPTTVVTSTAAPASSRTQRATSAGFAQTDMQR